LLSALPLGVFVVSTVASSFSMPPGRDLKGMLSVIVAYVTRIDSSEALSSKILRNVWPTACIWASVVATLCAGAMIDGTASSVDPCALQHVLVLALIGTFAAGWACCMLFVCAALTVMLDSFCCELAIHVDSSQAMQDWNILQAVFIKSSSSVERGFMCMLVAISFAVPLSLADAMSMGAGWFAVNSLLPVALIVLLFARVFVAAASISDKCAHVPSLVNSLNFGPESEQRRQVLVESIQHSQLGIYVCRMRLTRGMALRFGYIWSVVAIGLAANFPLATVV